ncbi:putative lipoprotein, partial [Salmonella enterica subsp. enterica serovar Heidelberg str. RI-11-014316]
LSRRLKVKYSYATVGAKTKEDAAKILDPLSAKYKNIAGVEEN